MVRSPPVQWPIISSSWAAASSPHPTLHKSLPSMQKHTVFWLLLSPKHVSPHSHSPLRNAHNPGWLRFTKVPLFFKASGSPNNLFLHFLLPSSSSCSSFFFFTLAAEDFRNDVHKCFRVRLSKLCERTFTTPPTQNSMLLPSALADSPRRGAEIAITA